MWIRNKWQRTPLERMEEAMEEAEHQIAIENQNLKYITDPAERKEQQSKIDN